MKETFDDILKRKWEAQSFPVDQTDRENMIALLDAQKRRRIAPFWWIGGLGILALVAGWAVFNQTQHPDQDIHAPMPQKQIAESTAANTIASGEISGSSSIDPAAKAISKDNTVTQTNPSPKPANDKIESSAIVPTTQSHTSSYSTKSTKKTNSPSKPKGTAGTSSHNNPEPKSQEVSTPMANTMPEDKKHYLVDEEAATSYQIISKPVAVIVLPDNAEVIPSELDNTLNARSSEVTDVLPGLDMLGMTPSYSKPFNSIQPGQAFHSTFHLFAEAGIGMVLPSQPDYASGLKLRAGAGIGYRLSPKLALSLSAGYLLQSGGFEFQRSSVVSQPGFGVRSSFNTLTPDKLHFVYSRIGAMYSLRRHILGVHGGIQYLYGTQGEISVQTHDQFVQDVEEQTTYAWLKKDGLRELSWTADLFYGYRLSPRLTASAGTDIYFSSFTVPDASLSADGYYWNGTYAALHPFVTLNYLFYGKP